MTLPACLIREAGVTDRGFIFSRFLKHAGGCFGYKEMPRPLFMNFGARVLEDIVDRSQALVVCEKANPNVLLGFAITERPFSSIEDVVLHYIWIEREWRREGLCTALVKALDYKGTLWSTFMSGHWAMAHQKFGAVHNPFFLFPQYQTEKEKK